MKTVLFLVAAAALAQAVLSASLPKSAKPYYGHKYTKCTGSAKYKVTVENFLAGDGFYKGIVPEGGLVFSPLTGAGHSKKISIVVLRGFATEAVVKIAEEGDNSELLAADPVLKEAGLVKSSAAADGPTMPGTPKELMFEVDCERPYISVVGMLAPSPDWIVAISNFATVRYGHFVHGKAGYLFAYDAGTDAGPKPPASIFTPPGDLTLDVKQEPVLNVHPLSESPEDPGFNGRPVGKYFIQRVYE